MNDLSDHFDLVIVGAGASGAVLAARSSEDPSRSVLVVEAGSVEPNAEADQLANVTFALTARDWGLDAEAVAGRRVPFPQGRAAGGGSAVNMALALRPLPEDLDDWAAAGNPGWSWADVAPSLRRLESDPIGTDEVHGRTGPLPIVREVPDAYSAQSWAFLRACQEVGLASIDDHNDGVSSGVGPFPMNRRGGERVSTAIAYLQPVRDRPNLTVWGDTMVERVVVDGGVATGIEVRVAGELRRVMADEVVLSAGAIQSPALLLRSGIGPAEDLRALGIEPVLDLPGVGNNLMEHPGAFLFVIPEDGVCDTSEPQFQLGARVTAPGSTERNDLLLGMMNHWDLTPTPEFRDAVGADVIFALTCGVLSPHARGSVRLASADPAVAPVIDLNLGGHESDLTRLVAALRLQHAIAQSAAMRDRIKGYALIDPTAFDSDDDTALRAYINGVSAPWYHPSGTCRMGPDPAAGAVVDAALRVHGIDRLRVADASIMPTIVRATTNLTAIAIGERAAELLRA